MLTKVGLLFTLVASLCVAKPFRFTDVLVTSETTATGTVFIKATGPLPPNLDFTNVLLWNLVFQNDATSEETQLKITHVTWSEKSHRFTIAFDPAPLAGVDSRTFDWIANFNNRFQATSTGSAASDGFFSKASSKDDADLYLFGSYLAGVGTKPIYSIDAKMNWVPEISETGYYFGLESQILTNSSVDPPVDRSRADPDSISAGLSVQRRFGEFAIDLNPVKGEFSRKYPASDLITAGTLKWVGFPVPVTGGAFVFYPFAGYEIGSNLNKPSVLFKQPVDLSGYNAIRRSVLGAHSALLFFRKQPTTDSPYRLVLQADYTARLLFAPEPFVTSQYINGSRASVTSMRGNARHYVESGITYNVSDLFGLEVKYRWGSLPPLFEFVDHQVTVGLTFKAKLPRTMRTGS